MTVHKYKVIKINPFSSFERLESAAYDTIAKAKEVLALWQLQHPTQKFRIITVQRNCYAFGS